MRSIICLALLLALGAAQNITYDYVIAGAGTAGLLLAVILSENPNITVAVLEAGGDGRADPNITNPQLRGTIQMTEYDWAFTTSPQPGLFDNSTGGIQPVPRGRTPGGTSAMNWMIHNTDSRVQLDIWESILNLTGWNWESLSMAFEESETMYAPPASEAQYFKYDPAVHGGTGPICSIFQRSVMSLFSDFLEPTLLNAGYSIPPDRNGGNATGAGFLPLAICPENYTRSYSGSAFTAVQNRSNLHLLTHAQVTGIDWRSPIIGNATAAGLRYINNANNTNETEHILARDVIISAGCIQSPQILELSGVGNPEILNPLGIKTIVNLTSVGEGLRDPPMMNYLPVSFGVNTSFTGTEYIQNFIQLESARDMLSPADYQAASQWLNASTHISGVPNAQLAVFKHLWFTDQPLIEMAWQFNMQNVTPYNLIPLSQGSVHINSSDPRAIPVINPNYNRINATINGMQVQWDMWFLAKAAQNYETRLATTAPMSSIITSSNPVYDLPFEQYYEDVFNRTGTSEHLTGGNLMLARESGGVVDTNLLVYGTSNVRIVDGSVFPYQPSAHPMGLTYALAVRAAHILQEQRGGGGSTFTEQAPTSANATAVFPVSNVSATASPAPPAYSTSAPSPKVNASATSSSGTAGQSQSAASACFSDIGKGTTTLAILSVAALVGFGLW